MNHPFKVLDGTLDKYKTEKVLPGANKYFGMIEKILVNSDKGAFVLGSKLTIADTSIYECVSWLLEMYDWEPNGPFTECMSKYPKVHACFLAVSNLPQMVEYRKKRNAEALSMPDYVKTVKATLLF